MIDTLLSLARLDAQQVSVQSENVALRNMVDDLWPRFGDRAYDKNVSFENNIPPDVSCASDTDHLAMIVSNVLDNAVEYCEPGGRIWTIAKHCEDAVLLSISNTGCQLQPKDVSHVFDSFWRSDESRTETGRHCGVGLAVVKKLADVLNATVEVQLEAQVFTMHLSLPCTPRS
jgi:two-component system sensor histidine kinase VicK